MFFSQLTKIPLGTLIVILLCIILHISLDFKSIADYSISPSICYNYQFYRLITGSIFHVSYEHLIFNMFAFLELGKTMETLFGTIKFIYSLLLFSFLANSLYILIFYILYCIFNDISYLHYNSVGISGVLFTLMVIQSFLLPPGTQSFFGFFDISTRTYPIVLLIIIQILLPRVSFVGHVTGFIIGFAFVLNFLRFLVPSSHVFKRIENYFIIRNITTIPSFCSCPNEEILIKNTIFIRHIPKAVFYFSINFMKSLCQVFLLAWTAVGLPIGTNSSYSSVLVEEEQEQERKEKEDSII